MGKQNIQLYPAKVRIVPNCKLAKVTSNLKQSSYSKLINGKNAGIVEKKKLKKHGELVSTFTITNADGYGGTDPLSFFDYSVVSVCDSTIAEGNGCITFAMILRALTGKTKSTSGGTHNGEINKDQRAAIMESVIKLMQTTIKVDNSKVNEALGYEGEKIIIRQILSAHIETTKINGQVVEDVVYFHKDENGETIKSPFFEVADQRNQIIRYDTELLDVPNQNNSPLVITLKNYVMLRVMEIKKHKMTPTLTLDDIFKKARIENKDRKTKQRAREYVDEFLKHLQEKSVIKSFEWTKKRNKFYGVSFTF